MLIRDILPPQKIKKIAKEEVLGIKTYENKRSAYLHLSLRAVFFCVLIFTILPLFPSRASEEGVLGAAQESIKEIGVSIEEGISSGLGEIVSGIEEMGSGLGSLLGVTKEPAGESFEDLPVGGEDPAAAQQPIAEAQPAAASRAKMTKMERTVSRGKERFMAKNPAGDEAGFSDPDETSDQPYLKMDKWGGEARLKIKIPHAANGSKNLGNDRLKIKNSKYEVEVYPRSSEYVTEMIAGQARTFTINEEGGVEFDLVLESVPESNVFEFPVECEGLKFYYQPPLDSEHPTWADTDGDGMADAFRPEIVVGSYAVYYEAQEGFFKKEEEAEKYKIGKAFHIYRPKVTDAAGSEIWGELYFDEASRVLKVTVDAPWLAAAVYPVRIDPNLGYETAGASSVGFTDQIRSAFAATATADGVAASLSAYMKAGGVLYPAKGNIYNSSYSPLDSTGTQGFTTANVATWYTGAFASTPSISKNSAYYATVWIGNNVISLYYDTATGSTIISKTLTYGSAWPTSSNTATSTYKYSIYATYNVPASTGSRAPGIGISGGGMLMF